MGSVTERAIAVGALTAQTIVTQHSQQQVKRLLEGHCFHQGVAIQPLHAKPQAAALGESGAPGVEDVGRVGDAIDSHPRHAFRAPHIMPPQRVQP